MLKVVYRGGIKPQVVTVYAVRYGEDGKTYFLIFDYDEWKWVDSYWSAPKEDENDA